MSLYEDLAQAKSSLDNNEISYTTFLNSTDPTAPGNMFIEPISALEKLMNSKDFSNASSATQKAIQDELNMMLGYADINSNSPDVAQFRQLYQSLGIDPKRLQQNRLQLKTDPSAMPVLDYSQSGPDQPPEWNVASSFELSNDAMKNNDFFHLKIYNNDGLPQDVVVKGYQINKNDPTDPNTGAKPAPVYEAFIPGLGPMRMRKDANGVPSVRTLSNGQIYGGSSFQTGQVTSTQNGQPVPEEQQQVVIPVNPTAYEDAQNKGQMLTKLYADTFQGTQPSSDWVTKQIQQKKSLDQVKQDLLNSNEYLQMQQTLGNRFTSPVQPQGQIQSPAVAPTGAPTGTSPAPMSVGQPVGAGGPGSVPAASSRTPGPVMPGVRGIPSLAAVRGFFRQMRP